MAALEVIALDTSVPQLMAPQAGDTYTFPRAVEMPLGTANGVLFLNGSKVVTSGSGLTFDGTNLGVGGSVKIPQAYALEGRNVTNSGTGAWFGVGGRIDFGVAGNYALIGALDGVIFGNSATNAEQMRLTSTGLGIGTNNPTEKLDVTDATSPSPIRLTSAAGTNIRFDTTRNFTVNRNWLVGCDFLAEGSFAIIPSTAFGGGTFSNPVYAVGSSGIHTWSNGSGSEQMRLDSTGLGIGTSSPLYRFAVVGATSDAIPVANFRGYASGNDGDRTAILRFTSSTDLNWAVARYDAWSHLWHTNGSLKATLDTSGNLGLGVTPSAWNSSAKVLQLNSDVALWSFAGTNAYLSVNRLFDTGSTNIYISNGFATAYEQDRNTGSHIWLTAPSGTAGNVISFSQAMTLDASGRLGIGVTSPTAPLQIQAASGSPWLLSKNGTDELYLGVNASLNVPSIESNTAIRFATGASFIERARITSGGDFQTSSGGSVQVGGTAARATTAGTNRIDIFDGTAPVGTLANGVSFYSASGEANVMDAAGNATLLSPHDTETNEWIFRSKHTPTGKVLRIDVERLLRFVNEHFGLDAVKEFVEP
jgi:hypothetical protein